MHIQIVSPSKAHVTGTVEEIDIVEKQLTYTNKSKQQELYKHTQKRWLKEKDYDGWLKTKEELEGQVKNCLLKRDGAGYWLRPGSIPYIKKLDFTLENVIEYPKFQPLKWLNEPEFEPYEYQAESTVKLLQTKHACVSLPTGCGKSYIIEMLIKYSGMDVVVITPGESIFNELLTNCITRFGKSMVGGYGDGKKDIGKKITIAISKSLTNLEEGTDAYDFFHKKQMMIVDESHTFAAETLEDVSHGVLSDVPYRFFLSATQTRGDGTEKLLNSIIGKCVLEMSIEDAIANGYLCPLNFTILETFTPSTKICNDSIENKREHFLRNKEVAKIISQIANAKWTNLQESTLILVEELGQIGMLAKLINVPFGYAHAGSKKEALEYGLEKVDTAEQVRRFNNGEIRVLVGTKCIATGTNIYPTHNTVNWVGGSSEIIVKQGAMGRSTRKLEMSKYKNFHKAKPFTNIYDFKIRNNALLVKQLDTRIGFYEEAKGTITQYKVA